ncbi:MAG: hypothetical protein IKU52_05800 [Clostridia bacterium]|nr:hypothetical protein [Clostridia bacterium]
MKIFKYILKEILYPASFLFTIYVFGVYGIAKLVNNLVEGVAVHPTVLICGFIYLLIVCAASKIFKTELAMAYKILISYASFALPVVLILAIAGKIRSGADASPISPSSILVILAVISVIYAIIATPVLIIKGMIKRKKNNEEIYENQFNKI